MYVIESSDGIIRLTDTLWLRTRRQSTMYIACIIWKWRKGGDLLLLLLKGLFNVHKKSAKLHKNMCEGKKVKTESENSENFPIWTDYLCSDSKNDRFWISCLKSMEGWRGELKESELRLPGTLCLWQMEQVGPIIILRRNCRCEKNL